ncbi:MAG: hypothetical protein OSB09_06205 [Planctomycetota bacterium]|nr:hypothetical protein [Planctomycetota bacterium]
MTDSMAAPDSSTLGVSIDLIHLPTQITAEQLRDVYMEVSGTCGYENFTRTPTGARLESSAGAESGVSGVSRVTFGKDRLQFEEQGTGTGTDVLFRRIEEVLRSLRQRVKIPMIVARTRNHRTLIQVPGGGQASAWLSENAFNLDGEDFNAIGRPASLSGLRLQLPPQVQGEAHHLVRIEAWLKDPRSLFIEDVATWRFPLPLDQMEKLGQDLRAAEQVTSVGIPAWIASLAK